MGKGGEEKKRRFDKDLRFCDGSSCRQIGGATGCGPD